MLVRDGGLKPHEHEALVDGASNFASGHVEMTLDSATDKSAKLTDEEFRSLVDFVSEEMKSKSVNTRQ